MSQIFNVRAIYNKYLAPKICFQKIREMKLRFENLEKKNYLDENLEKVLQTYLFLGSISHTNSNHHGR